MKRWLASKLYRPALRLHTWAVRTLYEGDLSPAVERYIVESLAAARDDAELHAGHLASETDIMAARLARRYDPAAALAEAMERARKIIASDPPRPAGPQSSDPAIRQHYESMRRNPPELTDKQKAALVVQHGTLQRSLVDEARRKLT